MRMLTSAGRVSRAIGADGDLRKAVRQAVIAPTHEQVLAEALVYAPVEDAQHQKGGEHLAVGAEGNSERIEVPAGHLAQVLKKEQVADVQVCLLN